MILVKIDAAGAAAKLARIATAMRAGVRSTCDSAAQALLALVQRKLSGEVLALRSGALRRSIQTDVAENARGVQARVFSDGSVPYARIQEFGGRIAMPAIAAVSAKSLAFAYEGRLVFARRANAHVATLPERSYLRASLAEFAPVLADSVPQARPRGRRVSEPQIVRESIYAALFALLGAAAPFRTATRRIKDYADVDQATQPALLQLELGEKWNARTGAPPVVTLEARLFVYCEFNDPGAPVSVQMNALLDAVTAALAPPLLPHGSFRQTLGGLVQHAAVAGEIAIAEGLSGQSEAVIPIEILVNN